MHTKDVPEMKATKSQLGVFLETRVATNACRCVALANSTRQNSGRLGKDPFQIVSTLRRGELIRIRQEFRDIRDALDGNILAWCEVLMLARQWVRVSKEARSPIVLPIPTHD